MKITNFKDFLDNLEYILETMNKNEKYTGEKCEDAESNTKSKEDVILGDTNGKIPVNICVDRITDILYIEAFVPKIEKSDISIECVEDGIIIKTEVDFEKNDNIEVINYEINCNQKSRKIKLAKRYINAETTAELKNGILYITITPSNRNIIIK